MATYVFKNLKTGEIEEHVMKMSEYDKFKKKNKHLERYFDTAPVFGYAGGGDFMGKKTDDTWKEVLSKISEQNPRSPLAEKYGKRSIKQIKTEQVLEKHAKLQKERKR